MSSSSRGQRLACALLYLVATVLAFPHRLGERVLDLGLFLAWLPPVALLLALRGLPLRRAAWLGFALGTLAHAGVWHWIWVVTVRYGHAPSWAGVGAPLLLATWPGLFTGAFAAGSVALARARPLSPFALAALWSALDHARGTWLTGWPWGTLGYAQHQNDWLLGLAPWTGVYGLSFVSVLGGASVLEWWLRREPGRSAARAALGLGAVLALHALGAIAREPAEPGSERVRVAVLQGNIDQGVKWTPAWAERTLAIYERLTREAASRAAKLVVWPETALPGAPDGDPALEARLASLARETGVRLVVGAVGLGLRGPDEYPDLFDSALLYDAGGARLDRYDKSHLVPFGEYLPLRALLGRFIRAIATGAAGRDVSAGPGPRALGLRIGNPGEALVSAGVPICYELLFPDLVRRFAGGGAQVLLAITNDAWYGRTGAPHQFLAITALRSAETGTWTARAANTGVSALIDARGMVREQTQIFEEALLVADVPLRDADRPPTFYARHGDVFAWGCWAASAALGVAAWRGRKRGVRA
jgi:apolipoprotein N-acyltransferase